MKLIFESEADERKFYLQWQDTRNPDNLLDYIKVMVRAGKKVETVDQARQYLKLTDDLNLVIFDVLMQSPEEAELILSNYEELRVIHVWDPDLYSAKNFINAVKKVYGGALGLITFRKQHRFDWKEKTVLGQVALIEIAEDPKAAVEQVKGSIYRGIPSFTWRKSTPWGKKALKNLPKDREAFLWYTENVLGQLVSEVS